MRRITCVQWLLASALIALVLHPITAVRAAGSFATPAFQQQWQSGEAAIPNFWGPLPTAHDGQREPYKEAPGGQRLVQYFDKTRMELTNGSSGIVTNGLLTVELKTGRVQLGGDTFDQRTPARVNIAGDPGNSGPTYADLSKMPGKVPQFPNREASPLRYENGDFRAIALDESLPVNNLPRNDFYTYLEDPTGRYGQFVFTPFAQFIQSLPLPISQTTGYPISPLFFAPVQIGGKATYVLMQAFERRVLTFNGDNSPAFRVEFGNIGQHYYRWRYGNNTASSVSATASGSADFTPFAKRWGHHGYQLIVNADGSAHIDFRTYLDCNTKSSDNIPCEDPYTSYAGHATVIFTQVEGQTATGQVTMTNDPHDQPANVTVTLTLKPYDMAELRQPIGDALDLCGPDFSKLAPASILAQHPCGA